MKIHAALPAALLLLACGGQQESPPRPLGVPADAAWVPAQERGGVFVRLRAAGGLDWRVEVWGDLDGRKIAEGRFALQGASLGELKTEDLEGWDGERFALKGGGALERIR